MASFKYPQLNILEAPSAERIHHPRIIFIKATMKTQEIILWTLLLIIIDQVIKIITNSYFLESHFDIIPSLIELKPTFNDKHSYFNSLLNRYSNLNIGLEIHLSLFLIAEIVILTLYSFFRSFSDNIKLLDIAIIFQMAGMICALIGNLIWENGTLDYIYLKPLFIFDLKDIVYRIHHLWDL